MVDIDEVTNSKVSLLFIFDRMDTNRSEEQVKEMMR